MESNCRSLRHFFSSLRRFNHRQQLLPLQSGEGARRRSLHRFQWHSIPHTLRCPAETTRSTGASRPLRGCRSRPRRRPWRRRRGTSPIHQALQHHSRPGIDGERPLAYSLDITGAAGGEEEGLGGEPFATYADDVRELVAALQRALNEGGGEAEEEQEGGDDEGGREEGDREGASSGKRLSEAVSVTRAFLHQQLRLAGDAERRSLAELRSAVKNLCLFEDGREGWRRRREAGGVGEEGGGGGGGDKEQPERLSEELKKEVRRGLESTLAVLLVEEEAAREKGLLH